MRLWSSLKSLIVRGGQRLPAGIQSITTFTRIVFYGDFTFYSKDLYKAIKEQLVVKNASVLYYFAMEVLAITMIGGKIEDLLEIFYFNHGYIS